MDFVTWRALLATTVIIAAAMLGWATARPMLVNIQASSAMGRDCAVIAAVTHEIYNVDAASDLALQSTMFDGRGRQWELACDWQAYGLSFPKTFDPNTRAGRNEARVKSIRFGKPAYQGRAATVEAGMDSGLLISSRQACALRQARNGGWIVTRCRETRLS
ncbi:hypothetical protein [Brevundimonas sp.]|uniref:hypothetical protein n=1 Tax=Brevundimonas sp. TaxID=1871086 RepID=UPI003BAC0123